MAIATQATTGIGLVTTDNSSNNLQCVNIGSENQSATIVSPTTQVTVPPATQGMVSITTAAVHSSSADVQPTHISAVAPSTTNSIVHSSSDNAQMAHISLVAPLTTTSIVGDSSSTGNVHMTNPIVSPTPAVLNSTTAVTNVLETMVSATNYSTVMANELTVVESGAENSSQEIGMFPSDSF